MASNGGLGMKNEVTELEILRWRACMLNVSRVRKYDQ